MNLVFAAVVLVCVSSSDQGQSSTVLYKCAPTQPVAGAIAPETLASEAGTTGTIAPKTAAPEAFAGETTLPKLPELEPEPIPAKAAPPSAVGPKSISRTKPTQVAVKPMRVAKAKPQPAVPDWVKRKPTKCGDTSAKWYFRGGHWRYKCQKS